MCFSLAFVYVYCIRMFIYDYVVFYDGGFMVRVVLSVRVRRELKEEAERLGIDVRSVVELSLIHI